MTNVDTDIADVDLAAKRLGLQAKMAEQRLLIGQLIAPEAADDNELNGQFPRSKTMRLITRHPAGTLQVVTKVGMLLLGGRMVRSITGLFILGKAFSAVAGNKSTAVYVDR